jgi:hypothetical protein
METTEALIAAALVAWHGTGTVITALHERTGGAQGYSGATLRYYDVGYAAPQGRGNIAIVTKDAPRPERRLLAWLDAHGLPVPASYAPDLSTAGRALVCLEYCGDSAPSARARPTARALAAIHHAAHEHAAELDWLPRADPAFFADRLVDRCWRKPWQQLLSGAGYTDWYDRPHPPTEPDAAFAATFAAITPALEAVAALFVRDMAALWHDAALRTLLHTDFHAEHARWRGDEARLIDWEQGHYGPYAIDLPNFFSREEALFYHEARAERGWTLPRGQFLAHYDAARPYPGFKYFGIGLWQWRTGDPARRHQAVQYWIDMVLKGPHAAR